MKSMAVITTAFVYLMALLALLGLPLALAGKSFTLLMTVWLAAAAVSLAAALLLLFIYRKKRGKSEARQKAAAMGLGEKVMLAVLLSVICLQIIFCVTTPYASGKAVSQTAIITEAVRENTLLTKDVNTGEVSGPALSDAERIFLLLWAIGSRLTGLSPMAAATTLAPLLVIPLSYMSYALLGSRLFNGNRKENLIFLLAVALLQTMGRQSEVTQDAFLLHSSFTGKTMMFQVFLPYGICCIYCLADILKRRRSGKEKG